MSKLEPIYCPTCGMQSCSGFPGYDAIERQRRIDETARALFVRVSVDDRAEWNGLPEDVSLAYTLAEALESERERRVKAQEKNHGK